MPLDDDKEEESRYALSVHRTPHRTHIFLRLVSLRSVSAPVGQL